MNLKVELKPAISKAQRATLLLNKIDDPAKAFSFDAPAQEGNVVRIPIPSGVTLPAGDYLARVAINGIASPLKPVKISGTPSVPKRLRSTDIAFSFAETNAVIALTGAVTVKDANGVAVEGASVSATWTLPGGTIVNQSANTTSGGVARLVVSNGRGDYKIKVNTITKDGYTFDRDNSPPSALEKSISIPTIIKRLRSTNIEFSFTETGNVVTLTGLVTVQDENGSPVEGASVSTTWTLPDSSIMSQSANTASGGVARLVISNGRGNYRLKVNNITKEGYTFDRDNSPPSALEKGISIFASNKLIAKTLELSGIEKENEPLLQARARVFVRDENNIPILEATVRLRWTFRNPAGTVTEEQTAISKTDGIAWFTLQKGEGTYRAEVIDIEKGAYTFLPDQGTTQKEHELPNVRLSSGSIFSTARQETDGTFTVKSSTTISAEAVSPEVPDALLIARWELPGNPPPEKWQERRTDARGNISFEINNGRGLYRFFISDIFKDGFTFRVAGSGLSDEITVP